MKRLETNKYAYGLIGNCQAAALIDDSGSMDWMCLPRPDSPPVFGRLLDPDGGYFSIKSTGPSSGTQEYVTNSPILETRVTCEDGSQFKITDFSPRFFQHGRIYRPNCVIRMVEPLSGSPSIRVECKPVDGWDKKPVQPIQGNSHLRFDIRDEALRLVTNAPLTYLLEGTPFALKEKIYFCLSWSYGVEEDLPSMVNRFLDLTTDYWRTWVKRCSIPTLYQKETIRSAITLKLHCFEDTGAILAALTTSLPEEAGAGRNWDYRYCWLRDAYFALTAFHNLGHFEEMEGFLKYILNIAENHDHSREKLRPVYRLDQTLPLPEIEHSNWSGYLGLGPVRSGNQAAEHVQNDVYGEMVLTLAPIFRDERFYHLRSREHERLLEHLAQFCAKSISVPDAGIWEIRNGWQEHSFSTLMSWAALDRLQQIQERGFLKTLKVDIPLEKKRAEAALRSAIVEGALRNGPKDSALDASLLQLPILRFPDAELCAKTTDLIWRELCLSNEGDGRSFLYRYKRKDDFGEPKSAFLICSFWLAQALAKDHRFEEANALIEKSISSANGLGLFPEHYSAHEARHAGNFPQAYSHVGLINSAFAVSPPWRDVL